MTLSTSSDIPLRTTGRPLPADPERRPDAARPPRASALRTAIARHLVEGTLNRMPLRIRHGDGPLSRPLPGGPQDGLPTLAPYEPAGFRARSLDVRQPRLVATGHDGEASR